MTLVSVRSITAANAALQEAFQMQKHVHPTIIETSVALANEMAIDLLGYSPGYNHHTFITGKHNTDCNMRNICNKISLEFH